MTRKQERIWLLIMILSAGCIVTILFPSVVTGPGYILTYPGGDGGKNVLAYLYHILYDKGFWFSGMNYPYGENIIYTDGQPLLSITLSYFKPTMVHALQIMGWSIVLSYFLAIIYVNKILWHFGVKPLIAIVFSGLIIIMSPQLFRSLAHFGLSYACILPMLFYWTLQYHQNRHWKYPAYIFVMGFIATFLHPYLSALVLMWTAFYSVGYFIFTRSPLRSKLRHVIPYLGSVLLLFATTGTIIRLTDPLKDRPITPYGFLVYCTKISHIFASHYSLIWKIVERRYKFIINGSGDEGFTYLGFTVVIAVCASVLFFIIKTITSKRKPEEQNDTIADPQKFQSIWLFVAFAALLLSMGIPFVWNMEWLVDYLSFLRQFRSLGRFSWIFYYVITIYGVVVISRYYTYCIARNRKVMGYGLLIASMALWSYEATGYVTTERFSTMYSKEYFELFSGEKGHTWKKFFEDVHHKPDEYQGLLMLPYSHIGSDKLWLGGDMPGLQIPVALEIGLQLHIPMIDAMMARSSWGITMKQVKIEGGPFVYKPMLDDLPNDKPFLLMNLGYNELTADQKYLLSASDSIGLYDQWYVYALYPRRLKVNDKKNADSIRALAPYLHTGDTCLRNTGTWYVDHFDHGNAKETFFGTGAIPQINKTEMPLADIPVHPLYRNQQYEVSCWFLLNRKDYKNPNIKIDVFDSSDHLLSSTLAPTKESTDNNGLWFRLVHYIYLTPECARIRCTLMNADGNSYEIMDEFMLRPGDALIVSKSANGAIMANNHLLPK